MRKYFFNGLYIRSELPLPEVGECSDTDFNLATRSISVRYGSAPLKLDNPAYDNSIVSIEGNLVLVYWEGIVRFLINGDSEVIIDVHPDISNEDGIRLLFMSVVLGVLLHKHNYLALHAATVKVGDAAILITGRSGAGKSTLSLGLYRKGYEIINDDVSSIFFAEDGIPMVYPGVRHMKLMAKSLEKYNYNPASFHKLRWKVEKYSFPVERLTTQPLPVKAIYILKEWNEKGIETKHMTGITKFDAIKNNTYKYILSQKLGKIQNHFALATKLSSIPIINVFRSSETTPADFADYMESQFQSL